MKPAAKEAHDGEAEAGFGKSADSCVPSAVEREKLRGWNGDERKRGHGYSPGSRIGKEFLASLAQKAGQQREQSEEFDEDREHDEKGGERWILTLLRIPGSEHDSGHERVALGVRDRVQHAKKYEQQDQHFDAIEANRHGANRPQQSERVQQIPQDRAETVGEHGE